jgi:hypothetical protein
MVCGRDGGMLRKAAQDRQPGFFTQNGTYVNQGCPQTHCSMASVSACCGPLRPTLYPTHLVDHYRLDRYLLLAQGSSQAAALTGGHDGRDGDDHKLSGRLHSGVEGGVLREKGVSRSNKDSWGPCVALILQFPPQNSSRLCTPQPLSQAAQGGGHRSAHATVPRSLDLSTRCGLQPQP